MNTQENCSINGCEKPLYGKGWCNTHYMRWRRNGDPLKKRKPWGEMKLFLDKVYSLDLDNGCITWPFFRSKAGYGVTNVGGKTRIASRVICEEVNGPPPTPKHQAAHSCGKGHEGCVNPKHLRWATNLENEKDKIAHGTVLSGEKHNMVKLTEQNVRYIRSLKGSCTQKEVARKFDVSESLIWKIWNHKIWRNLN